METVPLETVVEFIRRIQQEANASLSPENLVNFVRQSQQEAQNSASSDDLQIEEEGDEPQASVSQMQQHLDPFNEENSNLPNWTLCHRACKKLELLLSQTEEDYASLMNNLCNLLGPTDIVGNRFRNVFNDSTAPYGFEKYWHYLHKQLFQYRQTLGLIPCMDRVDMEACNLDKLQMVLMHAESLAGDVAEAGQLTSRTTLLLEDLRVADSEIRELPIKQVFFDEFDTAAEAVALVRSLMRKVIVMAGRWEEMCRNIVE